MLNMLGINTRRKLKSILKSTLKFTLKNPYWILVLQMQSRTIRQPLALFSLKKAIGLKLCAALRTSSLAALARLQGRRARLH